MRVVQISGAYVGAQKIIEQAIHKALLNDGNQSLVLYTIGDSDEVGIERYECKLSSLLRLALRKYCGKNPRYARWTTRQLLHRIKKYNPDLIHLHVLHQGYLDYEYLLKYIAKQKISVVFTMHDMWAFTGGCYYYTKENCMQFQTGCKECPADPTRLDNPRNKTAKYFTLKKKLISQLPCVQFVAVSQWVADEMKKSFLAEYPTIVIDNGIEPISLQKFPKGDEQWKQFTLLAVAASWDERKGIYRIFEMARVLGDAYQFYLVGRAAQEVIEQAPKNIHFLGYVQDKTELLQLYARADMHLSASFEETFGMTFVEAAFVGTRSIGYAATAVKSTLQGVHGVAVDDLNAEAMAKEIQRIATRDGVKLTDTERQSVIARYSCGVMAKKYCDVYRTLLEKELDT